MQTYHDAQMRQPDERMVLTWDGHRLLVHDSGAASRYELYEAPREHPDTWSLVEDWLSPPPVPLTGRAPDFTQPTVVGVQIGFAFVRSDGTVSATFDRAATRAELQRSLSGLR
jgi:hypothetical protein